MNYSKENESICAVCLVLSFQSFANNETRKIVYCLGVGFNPKATWISSGLAFSILQFGLGQPTVWRQRFSSLQSTADAKNFSVARNPVIGMFECAICVI